LTDTTTKQFTHRNAKCLALDVPQRLIDAGERAHVDRSAAVETAAVEHGPVILDVARVFADQVIGQLFDRGSNRMRTPFDHRLAPASDAFIGFNLEEQPAWWNDISGKAGNFHRQSLWILAQP